MTEQTAGAGTTDTTGSGGQTATQTEQGQQAGQTQQATWFFADGVPGVGDPPPYYKADKYKSLAEQAKAYTDLESLHGKKMAEVGEKLKGHAGAPETYELKMPEGWKAPEGVDFQPDPEHPLAKAAMEVGKKHGLTQDAMSDLYAAFVQSELSAIPDLNATLAQFEPDEAKRTTRINVMTEYLRANLGEAEYAEFAEQALSTIPSPAAVLKLTERLIGLHKPPRTITDPTPQANRDEQVQAWQKRLTERDAHGNLRMSVDPVFKRQTDEMGARLFPGEHREAVGQK